MRKSSMIHFRQWQSIPLLVLAIAQPSRAQDVDGPPELRELFTALPKNKQGFPEYEHRKTGLILVLLPGGRFTMGSPEGDIDAHEEERPQHEVTLGPFLMAKYELSQAVWEKAMGRNPSNHKGPTLPVGNVKWTDAKRFCEMAGLGLPTEAQWEYACRAGTKTLYSTGDTIGAAQANFDKFKPDPVESFEPNGFGLHNMHGNASEWCEDVFDSRFYSKPEAREKDPLCTLEEASLNDKDYRSVRGGDSTTGAPGCRSADRGRGHHSSSWSPGLGFRPAFNLGSRGKSRDDRTVQLEHYRKLLKSESPNERLHAAQRLDELGVGAETIDTLKALVKAFDNPLVQFYALSSLVDLSSSFEFEVKSLVADARTLLASPESNLQYMASRALLCFEDKESIPEVLRRFEGLESYRIHLVRELGQSRVEEAVPVLEKLLSSSDNFLRANALSALGMIGKQSSGAAVARLLADPDPEIRESALLAIALVDPGPHQAELRTVLSSRSSSASAALLALARLQDPQALQAIFDPKQPAEPRTDAEIPQQLRDGLRTAREIEDLGLLNYYNSPESCTLLEKTRLPISAVGSKPVEEILALLSRRTGKAIRLSEGVPEGFKKAKYKASVPFLLLQFGRSLSAMDLLRNLVGPDPETATVVSFVVGKDDVRIVPAGEVKAFWSAWRKARKQE